MGYHLPGVEQSIYPPRRVKAIQGHIGISEVTLKGKTETGSTPQKHLGRPTLLLRAGAQEGKRISNPEPRVHGNLTKGFLSSHGMKPKRVKKAPNLPPLYLPN